MSFEPLDKGRVLCEYCALRRGFLFLNTYAEIVGKGCPKCGSHAPAYDVTDYGLMKTERNRKILDLS